ncbi:uncharacterized protein LOC144916740 [Branchiostoma floridae x Branchiostoma belcheri]
MEFAFATWNVRGLTLAMKRQTLGTDCEHYNIDIACIQETKVTSQCELLLQTGHKLILMEQKKSIHHGLGFVIGPRLQNHVIAYGRVSDRIATLDLSLTLRNGRTAKCPIVNVYGPTTEKAHENPLLVEALYDELSNAIKIPLSWLLFVCGDFNSKLGKLSKTDHDAGLNLCIGSYGMDSRSYGGTDLNSDHKPVVTRVRMDNVYLVHKQKREKSQVKYDLAKLTNDTSTQERYKKDLQNQVANAHYDSNPNEALDTLLKCVHKSAAKTLGVLRNNQHRQHTNDPQVAEVSEKQKALRLLIYQTGKNKDRSAQRKERNTILRQIDKRLKELEIKRADDLADEISSTDDCSKMFRAARALRVGTSTPSLLVHNTEGHFIATDKGKADAIREWFLHQFTDPDGEKLDPFQGDPSPLEVPISEDEVKRTIASLRNGRSAGPDGVSNELSKYESDITSPVLTSILNYAFEHHHPIEVIGGGILIALPKPKKPPGPPANLRPITLLNSIRKILSTVALHRIRDKIDNFTGPYQSGFKRGRSCADIVWAQRMLVSVVMSKHWDFHKMGIDMSRAFDTVKRSKILEVLDQARLGVTTTNCDW